MPPDRTQQAKKLAEQEGRILLAIQAIKNEEIRSVAEAAHRFNVPRTTLRRRITGDTFRADTRANGHKLTQLEEESLKQRIISLDLRGAAPTQAHVREIANILLVKRGSTQVQTIGEKWVYNFIQRHPELKSRYSRQYNYQRAQQEDPKIIQEYILADDIYNFDETRFAIGLCSTQKVITQAEYYSRRSVLQPGNREWESNITKHDLKSFHRTSALKWTNNKIGLRWLQKQFIPSTTHRTRGRYRLLILNSHRSHLTPQFDQICEENNIIPIYIPAHSSHLLQPLDIGCFAVLKRTYSDLIGQKVRAGINHIDKLDFLTAYPQAHANTFKLETIKNSFEAAGIVPFDPQSVLSKLNIQLRTPTPPRSRGSQSSAFCPHTPTNIHELLKQASSIKAFLKQHSNSPPSPSHTALNQLIKGCQITIHNGILLEQENKQLRATNTIQRQKRARANRWVEYDAGITVQGAQEREQADNQPFQARTPAMITAQQASYTPVARRPPKCGKCGELGHRRNMCIATD
ncbi:hypothetical protein N7528_008019 [Penicillium herquei]|nr:hypothetical protein N7528_008019 [Penicillium herquei]